MQNFDIFRGSIAIAERPERPVDALNCSPAKKRGALGENAGRGHAPQIANQGTHVAIAQADPVDVDYGHFESGRRQQLGQRRCGNPGMSACDDPPLGSIGFDQRGPQCGQAVAAGNGPDQQAVRPKRAVQKVQCKWELIDRVERTDREAEIVTLFAEIVTILVSLQPSGLRGE